MLYSQIILTITSEWNFCVQGSGIILGTNFALRNVWKSRSHWSCIQFCETFWEKIFLCKYNWSASYFNEISCFYYKVSL